MFAERHCLTNKNLFHIRTFQWFPLYNHWKAGVASSQEIAHRHTNTQSRISKRVIYIDMASHLSNINNPRHEESCCNNLEVIKEIRSTNSTNLDLSLHSASETGSAEKSSNTAARSRDSRVRFSRMLVMLTLLLSAMTIGVLTYTIMSKEEELSFESHVRIAFLFHNS